LGARLQIAPLGIGFGTVAQQDMLAINFAQMKGDVCDGWKTIVIHTDEVCKRMRSHESERMSLIFGFELRGQVHAK
jgi:hypothetical protein